jgi:hypothetical protein
MDVSELPWLIAPLSEEHSSHILTFQQLPVAESLYRFRIQQSGIYRSESLEESKPETATTDRKLWDWIKNSQKAAGSCESEVFVV